MESEKEQKYIESLTEKEKKALFRNRIMLNI